MEPQTIHDTTKHHSFHQYNKRCCSNRNESADELIILRALYFSQRRAEEAERKLHDANQEKEEITKLIIEISARVSAYKNWGRIIEMDSALMERRLNLKGRRMRSRDDKSVHEVAMISWEFGFVLMGLVGAGFVLGRNIW